MIKCSQFKWKEYLEYNRPDININTFISWCIYHRPKKSVFDIEQELLETLQLYDNRKYSKFRWRQYIQENRPDIYKNMGTFKTWCIKNRPKKCIFDTEQELLQAISLYDKNSVFKWRQYLKENRPDIDIIKFRNWCTTHRPKKSVFNTKQELLETILLYDLNKIYIIRKTKYDNVYNLIERETGLRFNFYRIEDMIGLL